MDEVWRECGPVLYIQPHGVGLVYGLDGLWTGVWMVRKVGMGGSTEAPDLPETAQVVFGKLEELQVSIGCYIFVFVNGNTLC